MKHLFSYLFTNQQLPTQYLSVAVLLFRVFGGLMMIPYGLGKIQNFETLSTDFFGDPIGIGMVPSLLLTIFAQLICASALVLGLFSRPAAAVLAFNMLVASKYHWPDPFATLSLPLLFLGIYVMLFFLGGGKYSLDSLLFNQTNKK